eukprot:7224891-Pyramimonas_sp.AAC.1
MLTVLMMHLKTVRSYLLAGHSTRISRTLNTRPLRLRWYPLGALIFNTCNVYFVQPLRRAKSGRIEEGRRMEHERE